MNNKRARRTNPEIRKKQILDAAIKLSVKIGYSSITRDAVAAHANISSSLIANYFPTMHDLKTSVIITAVLQGQVEIIAQGLSLNDPVALSAPERLRKRAAKFIRSKK